MARERLDSSEYSRDNVARYHKRVARKALRKGVLLGIAALLVTLIVAGGIAAASWYRSINERLNDETVITEDLRAVLSEPAAPSDPYYVLLLGTDGRSGETEFRADTIILMRVDPPNKHLTLLSIPRDTHVIFKGTEMKINAAHYYDGPAGMIAAVQELTGVKISHYAEVDFDGLADITDALGGVWVDVDMYMFDDENFNHIVSLDPGYQELNGEAALFYTRCRHFYDGDYTRMRHQREFIKALIKQVINNPDPLVLFNVVNTCADMVKTDLSASEIISLASEFRGIDVENDIYTAHAPSFAAMLGDVSYVFVSQWQLDEVMEIIDRGEDPGPYLENMEIDLSSMPPQPESYDTTDYGDDTAYEDDTAYATDADAPTVPEDGYAAEGGDGQADAPAEDYPADPPADEPAPYDDSAGDAGEGGSEDGGETATDGEEG